MFVSFHKLSIIRDRSNDECFTWPNSDSNIHQSFSVIYLNYDYSLDTKSHVAIFNLLMDEIEMILPAF